MKIAIYHNHYSKSSGEDVMFKLECDELQKQGHEVLPVTKQVNDVLQKNSKMELAKMGYRAAGNPNSYELAKTLIREFQPDIAHVHNWFPILSPAIYQAHFDAGVPVVQTLHNYRLGCATGNFRRDHSDCEDCLLKGRFESIRNKCYQNSRVGSYFWKRTIDHNFKNGSFLHPLLHYICPSEEVRKRHLKIGLSPEQMTVLPNACRDPLEGHEFSNFLRRKVIFVGRLVKEKGVETLIDAWKKLPSHLVATVDLTIVGEGSEQAALQERCAGGKGIQFCGYLSHPDVLALLRESSILVFPSQWAEPFGLGIIEGMAAGCAVLASDIGGPSELIRHGHTGLLFQTGNAGDLAAKLEQLLGNSEVIQQLGKQGRSEYLAHYQPGAHAQKLEQLYQKLLGKK
jgi:glycosyltransferase involved in cell wall biosynthesis